MRGRRFCLIGVAVALGAALGSSARPARAGGELGGYTLAAGASALRLVLDSDALPVPAHPVIDATVPETSVSLETGPLGHGLATLFWPGDLGGHFGSALKQLGQLCTSMVPVAVPNLPSQCTPVPEALKANADAFNDPFKAETFFPGGPVDAQYFDPPIPGVTMSSHADDKSVESIAGFASFGAPGLGTLGSVRSRSVARRGETTAISEATSELFDVGVAGGLVTIEHVASTAKETTDGEQAVGTGRTAVSGLRIGGVAATVDDTGLHIGSLTAAANQALRALGLEIQVTAPDVLTDGAKGSFSAPVLVVRYRDDQNALEKAATALGQKLTSGSLQQVTGSLQQLALGPQAKVTLSLGGAIAAVDASPALAPPEGATELQAPFAEASSSVTSAASPANPVAAVEGAALTRPGATRASTRSSRAGGLAGALGGFGGLGWGLVLAAVAAALAIGVGLYRFALAADAAGMMSSGTGCDFPPRR